MSQTLIWETNNSDESFCFLFFKLFHLVFISFLLLEHSWRLKQQLFLWVHHEAISVLLPPSFRRNWVMEVSWWWSRGYLWGCQCMGNPVHEPQDCRVAQFVRTSPFGGRITAGSLGISDLSPWTVVTTPMENPDLSTTSWDPWDQEG